MPTQQDLFEDIELPGQMPQPQVSNRQRAIQQKQQSAFENFEIPEAVQAQMAGKASNAPKLNIQKNKKQAAQTTYGVPPSAAPFNTEDVYAEDLKTPKESIIDRIKNYFSDNNGTQVLNDAISWIRDHELWFAVVAVLAIAVGLIVSRYISFGAAIAFLLIGWIINFNKQVEDSFLFYIYALLVFIIPYLF